MLTAVTKSFVRRKIARLLIPTSYSSYLCAVMKESLINVTSKHQTCVTMQHGQAKEKQPSSTTISWEPSAVQQALSLIDCCGGVRARSEQSSPDWYHSTASAGRRIQKERKIGQISTQHGKGVGTNSSSRRWSAVQTKNVSGAFLRHAQKSDTMNLSFGGLHLPLLPSLALCLCLSYA